MKRLILIFLSLFFASGIYAQTKVDTYYNSYFERSYSIAASHNDGDELSIYFQVAGETTDTDIRFVLEGEAKINSFISSLTNLRDKYSEWSKVAKENNVKDYSKDFDITFPIIEVAWYGSQWWFDFSVLLEPRFKVSKEGKCYAIFVGEAESSRNEYITEDYYWVFASVNDFNTLINKIQPTAIEKKLSQKKAPDELFK